MGVAGKESEGDENCRVGAVPSAVTVEERLVDVFVLLSKYWTASVSVCVPATVGENVMVMVHEPAAGIICEGQLFVCVKA